MTLQNRRQQRAVGQGFFHTAELEDEEGRKLRYVYDCGAMQKYARQRSNRIDEHLKSVGSNEVLDVLFISHIHFDHISGLERLLDKAKGLKVDTIVMPLINVEDRLFAYARAVNEEPSTINDPFFRDLIVNPVNALGRFDPRQVLLVQRGSKNLGAPGSGRDSGDDPDGPLDIPHVWGGERQEGLSWKLIGSGFWGEYGQPVLKDDGTKADASAFIVDDTFAMMASSADGCCDWILSPFVDPVIKSKKDLFFRELAKSRGITVSALKGWLGDTKNVEELLLKGLPDLTTAYSAVAGDFNVTSLCLYSGPKAVTTTMKMESSFCRSSTRLHKMKQAKRVGWLATGDAALQVGTRAKAFTKHYGSHLQNTYTLTLPHHGSDHNHNAALIEGIDATIHVAAADAYSNWRHPGTKVMQCLASMGRLLWLTTSSQKSGLTETVRVRCRPK
ncbi:MBL fold metallo-hydrolase [Sulfitobacter geojensis]|uniref:MBL fold metallo-hydrolase n=1 Tax=Sulfitobacter geojensis TaxID=1342299 RepID=UPI00248FF7D3|nr:MBL fold metallo-hydrolase [Sulfitobacter geojensis]